MGETDYFCLFPAFDVLVGATVDAKRKNSQLINKFFPVCLSGLFVANVFYQRHLDDLAENGIASY